MRPAGLNDVVVLLLQTFKGRNQTVDRGKNVCLQRFDCRDVHGGGEGVVGRLGHIDVVVRMQELSACQLVCAVGDDLIGVHVRLCAGAGLPDDEREVLVKLAGDDFVAGRFNDGELLGGHFLGLQRMVCAGGGLFSNAEGTRDFTRHGFQPNADGKILVAALGLCAPVFVGGDTNLTHGVVFNAVFHRVHLRI